MKIFVIIISTCIFLWISLDTTFNGLDLRKKSSWLYGVVGFLCGLAVGTAITSNLSTGLLTGAIFAIAIMLNGAVMRSHQRNSKIQDDKIRTLYLQLKKRKDTNFFARLAQKILEKFI